MIKKIIYIYIIILLFFSNSFSNEVKDSKTYPTTLINSIKNSKDENLRIKNIRELSKYYYNSRDNSIEIINFYDQILNDEKESVSIRKLAARSLGYIEKDNAIEPLEKYISCFNTKEKKGENLFKYAQEQEVFRSAVDALSNYGKKVLPFLLEMYKDKLKVAIVSEVTMVAILGSVGGIDVIDVLKEKVKSNDLSIRRAVTYALSVIKTDNEKNKILIYQLGDALIRDVDGQVRTSAVEIFKDKKDENTYDLFKILYENDPYFIENSDSEKGNQKKMIYPVREAVKKYINNYDEGKQERERITGRIEISETKYDVGQVKIGEKVKKNIKIKNSGSVNLEIKSIGFSNAVEFDGNIQEVKILKPGEEKDIKISFIPLNEEGKHEYVLRIISSDKNNPMSKIYILLETIKDKSK